MTGLFCSRRIISDSSILRRRLEITIDCHGLNGKQAHEVYLATAIGNAPWPIGLTMVGIHERTGREKISSKNVAHIMNNEMQRKYLTSIKRLMKYNQDKRPDVAPSKKVRCLWILCIRVEKITGSGFLFRHRILKALRYTSVNPSFLVW